MFSGIWTNNTEQQLATLLIASATVNEGRLQMGTIIIIYGIMPRAKSIQLTSTGNYVSTKNLRCMSDEQQCLIWFV